MFFFRKKREEEIYPFEMARAALPEGVSYFSKYLDIVGTIAGNGSILIMGSVNGIFDMSGELNIGGTAKISGELRSGAISVNGFIEGTLVASSKVHLNATANIKGTIVTPILSVVEGALFDGEVRMNNVAAGIELTDNGKNEYNGIIKKKSPVKEAGVDDLLSKAASLISRNVRIEGNISGKDSIIIEGLVKGTIKIDGSIVVGASGVIEADVEADNISVQGNITGNVAARGQIDIQPSGRISGDISARSIDIKEGASFEGRSRMINYVSDRG